MTKTLYYVNTNGYDFLMTDDGETRRILNNEFAQCPRDINGNYENIDGFLAAVEDDSSWEQFEETAEELTADCKIIKQIEVNDI